MQPALGLGKPDPAPGARIAGAGRTGAWNTANTGIPLVEQRIVRNPVRMNVGPDLPVAPECEWIDFHQVMACVPLQQMNHCTGVRLITANAADPGVVVTQCFGKWRHFAKMTAPIWITGV
jgi:hypothetical protein